MRALITDYDFPDIELEREVFRTGGVDHLEAQCKSEDDLIAAAGECDALLLQHAPITDRVLAALPRIGLVSRYGAGFDVFGFGPGATMPMVRMIRCPRLRLMPCPSERSCSVIRREP